MDDKKSDDKISNADIKSPELKPPYYDIVGKFLWNPKVKLDDYKLTDSQKVILQLYESVFSAAVHLSQKRESTLKETNTMSAIFFGGWLAVVSNNLHGFIILKCLFFLIGTLYYIATHLKLTEDAQHGTIKFAEMAQLEEVLPVRPTGSICDNVLKEAHGTTRRLSFTIDTLKPVILCLINFIAYLVCLVI